MPRRTNFQRQFITDDDEKYVLPVNLVSERPLTLQDEELLYVLVRYPPRTRLREGDIVMLNKVPLYLRNKLPHEFLPRFWKVRFVISRYAFDIVRMAIHRQGYITLTEAKALVEHYRINSQRDGRSPIVYMHGYPHGEYPDTAVWAYEHSVDPTIFREKSMIWEEIVHEAEAPFEGYDLEKIALPFTLDIAPDHYGKGQNIGHPFRKEEPLVQTMYNNGLEKLLEVPHVLYGTDPIVPLDRDHDIYRKDNEDE